QAAWADTAGKHRVRVLHQRSRWRARADCLVSYESTGSTHGASTTIPPAGRRTGMAFDLLVNGTRHTLDADPQTPLLWVIRDHIGLTGTKFGCGIGQCGACTVHVDGQAVRSCSVPANNALGKSVTTIEGLSPDGNHPIQIAWKEFDT